MKRRRRNANGQRVDALGIQGVVSDDGRPIVLVRWGKQVGQLPPATAVGFALRLIECAESASQETLVVGFLTERHTLDADHAAQLLADYRRYKERILTPAQPEPGNGEPEGGGSGLVVPE